MSRPGKLLVLTSFLFLSLLARGQQKDSVSVYFDFNSSEMTNPGSERIDNFLYGKNRKNLFIKKIGLKGYCDKIGSNKYNDRLAARRVKTVKQYLLNMGFESPVITSMIAYGERKPINKNLTEQERALNRRVEIFIETEPFKPVTSLSKQLLDTNVKVGSTIILRNLNFHYGRHFLIDQSVPILRELLQALKANPKLTIEIQGHVCCTLSADALDVDLNTPDLSYQRAKAIFNYLVENGIAANRLSYRGFGSSRKLYPNERNEFERQENRRVEIKILSK